MFPYINLKYVLIVLRCFKHCKMVFFYCHQKQYKLTPAIKFLNTDTLNCWFTSIMLLLSSLWLWPRENEYNGAGATFSSELLIVLHPGLRCNFRISKQYTIQIMAWTFHVGLNKKRTNIQVPKQSMYIHVYCRYIPTNYNKNQLFI